MRTIQTEKDYKIGDVIKFVNMVDQVVVKKIDDTTYEIVDEKNYKAKKD